MRLGRKQCPMKIELPGSARAVSPRGRPRRLLGEAAQRNAVHRGFLRSSIDSESSVVTAQLLFDKRKRSRGPIRRLFGGAARSPRGWALVGGGYLIGTYRRPMKPWSSKATGPRSQDA